MSSPDVIAHVRGESPFIADLPEPAGTLHAAVVASPIAHGEIRHLDATDAVAAPGVVKVFTARDIPGENQVGTLVRDEPLLAPDAVHYVGQPIAVVVAATAREAREAVRHMTVEIEERPAVFDPRAAAARGDLIAPARTLSLGQVDEAWSQCPTIVEGRADSGGQEHVYLETQASLAVPRARGRLHLHAGTQSPSAVQRIVARVLGCRMHDIEVEVDRLGGAFGGKEEQATPWAAMAALAARTLQRPVKLVLNRHEDMCLTGKRHPYSSDFKLGLGSEGNFVAFEATYYQNSGAAADLSPAVLERTLFHATNAYYVPNVCVTGMCCRTNLPPFTAFRGFGGPQAMFVMESAIAAAAEILEIPARRLQQQNLLSDGDELPYGMRFQGHAPRRSFAKALARFDVEQREIALAETNTTTKHSESSLALMPVCFGISFTNRMLNQAGALLHIYTDGSVSVSTAAVEMGQGVLTKLRRIVAERLGIGDHRVRLESTSTARVANMSPTAASAAADLNGGAALMACRILTCRLAAVAAEWCGGTAEQILIRDERVWHGDESVDLDWEHLVTAAYLRRIDLSAHAFYATPDLHYDKSTEKGHPFAYHVCGTSVTQTHLDTLRGTAKIDSVEVIHDAGRSLDPLVDRGQAEGAIVQGIGWVTLEELVRSPEGRLLSDSLTTYKVPDLHFAPRIDVVFFEDSEDPSAVLQSKAIGEPPFMYGLGAFFALRQALRRVHALPRDRFQAPLTHERILEALDSEGMDAES